MSIFKIKLPLLAAIVGVVFAVGTMAFAKIKKPLATYTFAYQPTTFDEAQVESVDNWAIGSPGCNNVQNKACEIVVQEQFTHLENGVRVLNDPLSAQHITIVAIEGGIPDEYMVDGTASTNISSATNKQ